MWAQSAEQEPELGTVALDGLDGPVEIFRDPSVQFAADAWTTRRARDIFCYIATSKNRRVLKEVLIEALCR